jgi:hypothetical protein
MYRLHVVLLRCVSACLAKADGHYRLANLFFTEQTESWFALNATVSPLTWFVTNTAVRITLVVALLMYLNRATMVGIAVALTLMRSLDVYIRLQMCIAFGMTAFLLWNNTLQIALVLGLVAFLTAWYSCSFLVDWKQQLSTLAKRT